MKAKVRTTGAVIVGAVLVVTLAAFGYALGISRNAEVGSMEQAVGEAAGPAVAESPADGSSESYRGAVAEESVKSEAPSRAAIDQTAGPAGDRLVIATAAMELRVDDVQESLEALRSSVAKSGGEVAELSVTVGQPLDTPTPAGSLSSGDSVRSGPSSALVTIRVPIARLESLREALRDVGRVQSESASANDVSEDAVDLRARLKNLRAEEARLRGFLARADKVDDLLAVERELARVRGEIESMDAQLTYLERQAARATLTVSLAESGPVVQPKSGGWGLREAVTRGIQATVGMVAAMITVAIPLAFLGALTLAVAYPVARLVHRKRDAAKTLEQRTGGTA